jgi:trimethylamine monooxygenase
MGVVFINNPKLMYLGMQAQYFSFMMFEIQSHFAKSLILNKLKLPLKQEMKHSNYEHSLH